MPFIQSRRLVWFILLQTETLYFRSASIIFAGFYQPKSQSSGLRSQDLFPVRTEAGKDAFRFAAPCDWNTLQIDLKLKALFNVVIVCHRNCAAARRRQDTQDALSNFQNNCHFYQTGKDKEVLSSILDHLSASMQSTSALSLTEIWQNSKDVSQSANVLIWLDPIMLSTSL